MFPQDIPPIYIAALTRYNIVSHKIYPQYIYLHSQHIILCPTRYTTRYMSALTRYMYNIYSVLTTYTHKIYICTHKIYAQHIQCSHNIYPQDIHVHTRYTHIIYGMYTRYIHKIYMCTHNIKHVPHYIYCVIHMIYPPHILHQIFRVYLVGICRGSQLYILCAHVYILWTTFDVTHKIYRPKIE